MSRKTNSAIELKNLRERTNRAYKWSTQKSVRFQIPKPVTSKFVLAMKPTAVSNPKLWRDAVYYFLHCIVSESAKEKYKSSFSGKYFVALKHRYLREVMGDDTTVIIKALIANGVVETDGKYFAGGVSLGYKLRDPLRKAPLRFVTLAEASVVRRHKRVQKKRHAQQVQLLREHAHLLKGFLNGDLLVNKHNAELYLTTYCYVMKGVFSRMKLSSAIKDSVYKHVDATVKSTLGILQNWSQQKPSIDNNGGRLYTPLTGILSPIRHFVTHRQTPLVYLDIKNSQPFHLLFLLNPNFWRARGKGITLRKLNPELYEYLRSNSYVKRQYSATTMMLKAMAKTGRHRTNKGLQRNTKASPQFPYLVASGKLYKFITEQFRGKFRNKAGVDPFADPDSAKHSFIRMLYFNPREKYSPSHSPFAEFKRIFPEVAAVIELLKSRHHADFAILLQKIESTMLLKKVALKLFRENSEIPVYTIHDGIMTTVGHRANVERAIKETYSLLLGVKPEFKIERMTARKAFSDVPDYIKKKVCQILVEYGKNPAIFRTTISPSEISVMLQAVKLLDMQYITSSCLFTNAEPSPDLVTFTIILDCAMAKTKKDKTEDQKPFEQLL